jgi:xanthine dehydrogenase YagS FAD-binding subunit
MQPFALVRPKQLIQVHELVRAKPDNRVLRAGGIDLLDRMKEGLDDPELVVDLRNVAELAEQPPQEKDLVSLAALTTLAQLAEMNMPGAEALTEAAREAATPSIRNTATLGGNLLQRPRCWYFRNRELVCLKKGGDLCLAMVGDNRYNAILGGGPSYIVHPSSLGAPLLALDAALEVFRGPSELGRLAFDLLGIADLFVTPEQDPTREHSLGPGDVLHTIHIPLLPNMRSAYQAVREKQSHDWPLAEAAVRMCIGADGTMRDVRVALGHVAPIPWHAKEAESVLEGQKPDAALFERAAEAALAPASPLDGNAYKVPLSKGLLREVFHRASGLPLPE